MRSFILFLGTPSPGDKTLGDTYETIVREAMLADELGYYGAWVTEHHFVPNYGVIANPMLLATAIAYRTRRIRVGPGAIVLPLHNPVRVVEDILMADALTGGRIEVALCRGDHPYEYEVVNADYASSGATFASGLDTVVAMLSERIGKTPAKTATGVPIMPLPPAVQRPHPPLWVTCGSATSIALALERGLNVAVAAGASHPRERIRQMRAIFETECRERGLDPAIQRFGVLCSAFAAQSDAERERAVAAVEFVNRTAAVLRDGRNSAPGQPSSAKPIDRAHFFDGHLIGSEDFIARQIEYFASAGVTDLFLLFARSFPSTAIQRSMTAIAPIVAQAAA